ncbi:glycosyltransferase family 2 protein [Patulibacter americanus]|uniref:glycosyltransferase family 2 protein n=1 Tax=Patulibacter americanus TaxID=588672 RepID=UPI0003B4DB8E|nr:glycosyltransferase [Patulibacter americanus]
MSRVTILMLSVNEAPLLRHSLPAACAQGADEVVVIDNACTDATPELCERYGARRLRLTRRRGYAAAMNAGIAACGGDWILWCNADCVLEPGFLEALRPHLYSPTLGAVVPRLMRATGMEPQDRLDELDAAGLTIDRRRRKGLVGHGLPPERFSRTGPVFGGDGACVLYRRECLDECAIGLEVLDEDMGLWATDADLAWRAQLLGWEARYEPRAVAWHKRFSSPSTRASVDAAHLRLQFRNRLLMIVKNETAVGFLRSWPSILGSEVLALSWAVLRERFLLGAYLDVLRGLPAARRRRRWVQSHHRAAKRGRTVAARRGRGGEGRRRGGRSTAPPFGMLPPGPPAPVNDLPEAEPAADRTQPAG